MWPNPLIYRTLSLLLLPLLLVACAGEAGRQVTTGDLIPALSAQTLAGEQLALTSGPGQALWLTFWASWCVPCRAEWPDLDAAARDLGPDVRIIAIAVNETPETVAAFVAEHPAAFTVALDREGQLAERFAVTGFPTHVLVGTDGRVQQVVRGPLDGPRAAALLRLAVVQRSTP